MMMKNFLKTAAPFLAAALLLAGCAAPASSPASDAGSHMTQEITSEPAGDASSAAAPAGDETPLAERDPAAAAFLEWVLSDQGQELVEKTGYVGVER